MKVTIDYCTECGHLEKALEVTENILEEYGEKFDKLELVPSDGGVLRVSIEGEVVYDIDQDSFTREEIIKGVEEYLSQRQ